MEQKVSVFLPRKSECQFASEDAQFVENFEKYNFETQRALKTDNPYNADVIIIFEQWSFKQRGYIDELLNDQFVRTFAEKIYVINYDDIAGEGFLPGCYTSLKVDTFDAHRFQACAYPKVYNELIIPSDNESTPDSLFSFMGTSHSHPIRKRILSLYSHYEGASVINVTKDFHTHTDDDKKSYIDNIIGSKFVLCPRGWSPSTYRMFEVMSLGRCPVIISDDWVPVGGIDWSECSIRISEKEIQDTPDILKRAEPYWSELGQNAEKVWRENFSDQAKYQFFLQKIIELHSSGNATKNIDGYAKYWNSNIFLTKKGWTFKQRLLRRLKK